MYNSYIIEGIGYLGSMLVVVSMLMVSVKKLRIVNTAGSTIFTIYALIIHSYPTALMNICLVSINIYQLIKLERHDASYQLVRGNAEAGAVPYLLQYYLDDIQKFFPYVRKEGLAECDTAFMIMYETTPAGLFIGNKRDDGSMDIWLDYAMPTFRDTSVGTFLYRQLPEEGVKKIISPEIPESHKQYMKKMGFVKTDEGFVKEL